MESPNDANTSQERSPKVQPRPDPREENSSSAQPPQDGSRAGQVYTARAVVELEKDSQVVRGMFLHQSVRHRSLPLISLRRGENVEYYSTQRPRIDVSDVVSSFLDDEDFILLLDDGASYPREVLEVAAGMDLLLELPAVIWIGKAVSDEFRAAGGPFSGKGLHLRRSGCLVVSPLLRSEPKTSFAKELVVIDHDWSLVVGSLDGFFGFSSGKLKLALDVEMVGEKWERSEATGKLQIRPAIR